MQQKEDKLYSFDEKHLPYDEALGFEDWTDEHNRILILKTQAPHRAKNNNFIMFNESLQYP